MSHPKRSLRSNPCIKTAEGTSPNLGEELLSEVALSAESALARVESAFVQSSESEDTAATGAVAYRGHPAWKRAIDICGSIALIVLLSPVLLLVALHIKRVSQGPVFFTQARCGAGGRKFTIYKFRTMHQCKESEAEHRQYIETLTQNDAPATKPKYDHRLIPGGEFLRGHSFDELPQLLNVLNGTMSLVGPRPEVLELHEYPAWQLRRFEVLPGMTGLWQVSGKNRLSFNRMIELDIEYIEKQSLWLDISILLKTFKVVLHQDNA
jgi:lipopolysaccharide/colanic/teichoic acid biosynthesis glycosyltransferase